MGGQRSGAILAVAHTHTHLLALHLAGPLGRPQPQILLRTPSIAEPGCRLHRVQWEVLKICVLCRGDGGWFWSRREEVAELGLEVGGG